MFNNYPTVMGCKYVLTSIYMLPVSKRLNLSYCVNSGLQKIYQESLVDKAKLSSLH